MTIFQFHIVRLKDAGVALQVFPHTFQFHIVRLKVRAYRTGEEREPFQFHIVRLKVNKPIWTSCSPTYFNSI